MSDKLITIEYEGKPTKIDYTVLETFTEAAIQIAQGAEIIVYGGSKVGYVRATDDFEFVSLNTGITFWRADTTAGKVDVIGYPLRIDHKEAIAQPIHPSDWQTLQRIANGSKISEYETPNMGMPKSFRVGKGRVFWNSDILDNFAAHGYLDRATNRITDKGELALALRNMHI